jgi:hypothetical protein
MFQQLQRGCPPEVKCAGPISIPRHCHGWPTQPSLWWVMGPPGVVRLAPAPVVAVVQPATPRTRSLLPYLPPALPTTLPPPPHTTSLVSHPHLLKTPPRIQLPPPTQPSRVPLLLLHLQLPRPWTTRTLRRQLLTPQRWG